MPKSKKHVILEAKRAADRRYREKNKLNEEWLNKEREKTKRYRTKKKVVSTPREKALQRRKACERKRLQRKKEKVSSKVNIPCPVSLTKCCTWFTKYIFCHSNYII